MRSTNSITRFAIGVFCLCAASTAWADVLVVRAIGPSAAKFKPGMVLRDSQRVQLGPNDTLVLLDERGTRTVRGPGVFAARATGPAPRRTQYAWTQDRRARIGAVRAAPGATKPNLWLVDTSLGGTACVIDPAQLTLWRSDTTASGKTRIAGSNGASGEVEWAAGEATKAWPAALRFTSGTTYTISGVGTTEGDTAVTLKLLASPPAGVQDTGKALIDAGCQAQLELLMEQVDAAAEAQSEAAEAPPAQ